MIWRRVLLLVGCIVPWLIAGAGVLWVMERHLPEDGTLILDLPLDGRSPWFESFLPGQRATSPGPQEGGWTGQRITDEPVYARLRVPGAYDTAEVSIEFRPEGQPLLELGVERGAEPVSSFELVPLWSKELTASTFVSTTIDGVRWLVDPAIASRVHDADVARVTWHASGTKPEAFSDTGTPVTKTIRASLRGQHDFWMIPLNGRIDLALTLQDMNRSRNTSRATLRFMRGEELLWTDSVSFGGRDDARPSPLVDKVLNFKDLRPGVYKLSVLGDDSLFLRGWSTTVRHWVLGPRVYFADEVGYSTSTPAVRVWTNASYLEVKTLHKEGLQTVALGSATTTLESTHTTSLVARPPQERKEPVVFSAPKGTVWTLGDGYVSWTKEALFFPQTRRFTDQTRLEDEGIQAVATRYTPPEALGDGWYKGTGIFRIEPDQDRVKLIVAAPGIARRGAQVDIRRIRVTYRRPPRGDSWWPSLRAELRRAWYRW